MPIVVGLGNPGERYRRTRHNVGFMVVDALAVRAGAGRELAAPEAWAREVRLEGRDVLLVKPLTWMNRSGAAVAAILARRCASPAELIVVLDDAWLEPGRIRVRARGGHGGHNGLRSIVEELGTEEFPRVRVGIGGAEEAGGADLADYVLSELPERDTLAVRRGVEQAGEAVLAVIRDGPGPAMNRFNARPREVAEADTRKTSESAAPDREPARDSLPPTGKGPRGA